MCPATVLAESKAVAAATREYEKSMIAEISQGVFYKF